MMKFLILLCTTILSLSACSLNSPTTKPPIMLTAVYNLQGVQAGLDIPSSQGALLAIEQINAQGGILNRNVQLQLLDGQSNTQVIAEKTLNSIQKYPQTTAVFGLSDTDMVLAAAPVAAQQQRLFLTSGATSPILPKQIPDYLFLACFGDNVQAAAAAEWVFHRLAARSVTVLYNQEHSYTKLLQGYFQTRFKQLGGEVLSSQAYKLDQINVSQLHQLAHADILFLAAEGPEEALKVSQLLRLAGFEEPIIGGDGFDSEQIWSQNPKIDNIFFTSHAYLGQDNPNPTVISFLKAFKNKYPDLQPDAFTALGYDTVSLLKTAINHAGTDQPNKVRLALSEIQNFEGVSGTISYTNNNQIPMKSVAILAIEHGKIKWVEQKTPTKIPSP